jgi:hypothetical protein
MRVTHRRESSATPDELWDAARTVRIADTSLLGRLVRWRIPGISSESSFDELFRRPPFIVLDDDPGDRALVSGLVGRIWTLRRDYPELADPDEFRGWSKSGTAKVVFANWVEPTGGRGAILATEVRVDPIGAQGRFGLAAVRPLVRTFHNLIGSDGIEAAVRRAERG